MKIVFIAEPPTSTNTRTIGGFGGFKENMPTTPAPHPDLHGTLSKVLKLKAENSELQRHNRNLLATVQRLEASLKTQPDEVMKVKNDNEGLLKQLEEMVKQMIEAEEKVISAETKAQEFNKRSESVAEARDKIVAQKDETISELREQNTLLQEYMNAAKSERDTATQDKESLAAEVDHLKQELHNAKQRESDVLRESLGDVEILCGKMEAQIQKETALRVAKENECTALATELEETKAAAEEAAEEIVRYKKFMDGSTQEKAQRETLLTTLRNDADGLRRDLKEQHVAVVLLQKEIDILNVELKMQKELNVNAEAAQAQAEAQAQAQAQVEAQAQAQALAQAQAQAQTQILMQEQLQEQKKEQNYQQRCHQQAAPSLQEQSVRRQSLSPQQHRQLLRQQQDSEMLAQRRPMSPQSRSASGSASSKPVTTKDMKQLELEMEQIAMRWQPETHNVQQDAWRVHTEPPSHGEARPTLSYLKQRYMSST